MSVDDVTEILAIPLLGAIPDDEQVVIGTNQGEPVIGLQPLPGRKSLYKYLQTYYGRNCSIS